MPHGCCSLCGRVSPYLDSTSICYGCLVKSHAELLAILGRVMDGYGQSCCLDCRERHPYHRKDCGSSLFLKRLKDAEGNLLPFDGNISGAPQ